MINNQEFISFDKTEHTRCDTIRPEKYSDIFKNVITPVIARGAGLSYCNAGATAAGTVIDMRRMNKILAFDSINKTITVESGICIGDLNNFLISNHFIFPVLPGYPLITVGGCIAFNIHGKSQFKVGTFKDWIKEIVLYHPDHGEMICSPDQNKNIFDLTIGGFGLTGIIISATLQFKDLPGGLLISEKVFIKNLTEAVEYMQHAEHEFEYVYSWNNLNKENDSFGQGIVYLEKYGPGNSKTYSYKDKTQLSYKLPALHSDLTITAMCTVFYLLEKFKPKCTRQSLHSGSFPIYNKEIYYHLFGKKGFREYQVLLPWDMYEAAFEEIRKLISKMKMAVALGSLKLFNGTAHQLSFTGSGVCLTIDVKESEKSILFFNALDEIAISYGAIINLSKDSRADHALISKLFKKFPDFKDQLIAFDPENKIRSELKTRLNLENT